MYDKKKYNSDYYLKQDEVRFTSARAVLGEFFKFYKPNSVIDIGCGLGHWLKVCQELGIGEIYGYDGNQVDKKLFKIDPTSYILGDFEQEITPPKRVEMAMTIEVGEHLPAQCAATFVKSLTNCADVVLFSAAPPGQGGTNHFNEQPPAYWAELFNAQGYDCLDFLRDKLWENNQVSSFHRQNILVFVKKEKREIFEKQGLTVNNHPLLRYHPELYQKKVREAALYRLKSNLLKYLWHKISRIGKN